MHLFDDTLDPYYNSKGLGKETWECSIFLSFVIRILIQCIIGTFAVLENFSSKFTYKIQLKEMYYSCLPNKRLDLNKHIALNKCPRIKSSSEFNAATSNFLTFISHFDISLTQFFSYVVEILEKSIINFAEKMTKNNENVQNCRKIAIKGILHYRKIAL